MAIGDKKNVVMEFDKGVAGGVATLGIDGILAGEQRPSADGLFMADGITSIEAAIQRGAGDMNSSVYDPQGKKQDIFAYVDNKEMPVDGVPTESSNNAVSSGGTYAALKGKADTTLSNISDKQEAIFNLGAISSINNIVPDGAGNVALGPGDVGAAPRPNLLLNARWDSIGNIIDQKQGYVVPPGTPYYSDTSLTSQVGVTDGYRQANYVDGTYGIAVIGSGETYYIDWSAALHGYFCFSTNAYTIEAHCSQGTGVFIKESERVRYIRPAGSGFANLIQTIDMDEYNLHGKTVTLSALILENKNFALRLLTSDISIGASSIAGNIDVRTEENVTGLISITVNIPQNASVYLQAIFTSDGVETATEDGEISAIAWKLEVGDTQTLARQLEDGTWELIDPPPDPTLELLKCQRYYQIFSTREDLPTDRYDYRPVMRVNPACGTIYINGQAMYFADANL